MRKVFFSILFGFLIFGLFEVIEGATLELVPGSGTFKIGEIFEIKIILDTKGERADGVDIHYLNFDPNLLEVQDQDSPKSGVQIEPGSLFPNTMINKVDNFSGKIEFSQISSPGNTFQGKGTLAKIKFKVLDSGTGSVYFDFTPDSTIDCNVPAQGREILNSVINGEYTLVGEEETLPEEEKKAKIKELKNKIAKILKEIARLRALLAQILSQKEKIPSDFRFTKNLYYGMRGKEVRYLQIFLSQQGPEIYPEGLITGFFGLLTKRAVIRFQEKYSDDILAPWRLKRGTGLVGRTTRLKINQLLGE